MTRAIITAGLAFFALAIPLQPTFAEVGDKAWAQCVWDTSATSADLWLMEETPTWQDNLETRGEVLGFRLIGMCSTNAADPENPNDLPNWRSMKRRLNRERPETLPTNPVTSVSVELCESFSVSEEQRALYRVDIVRIDGSERTTVFQQYFTSASGRELITRDKHGRSVQFTIGGPANFEGRVRLPQVPMITAPADGFSSETICRTIQEDGTLSDA